MTSEFLSNVDNEIIGDFTHMNDQSFIVNNQLNVVIYMRKAFYAAAGHWAAYGTCNNRAKFGS